MKHIASASTLLFSLLVALSLTTPSWRYGPFSWAPVWTFEHLAGGPMQLGVLNIIPLLLVLSWLVLQRRRGSWTWGPRAITLPLFLFTVWALFRLVDASFRLIFIFAGDFILVWLIYLYYINERPALRPMLSILLLVQATVGVLQFMTQEDLGLVALGELPLNPAFEGVTVLQARGEPWLRAYGLTAHPNLLGALIALCLLFIGLAKPRPPRQMLIPLIPIITLGLLGLFFSFSRTAWLGLGLGLGAWTLVSLRGKTIRAPAFRWWFVLPALLLTVIMLFYGDLVLSRFANLDQPLEARSISQRLYDADLALQLAKDNPLLGVGLGQNVNAASQLRADADRVHNVLLLAAAELGVPGFLLVLWLLVGPMIAFWRLYRAGRYTQTAAGLAPWILLAVVNQFDTTLWLTGNWQTAILFALTAGNAALYLQPLTAQRSHTPEPAPVTHSA